MGRQPLVSMKSTAASFAGSMGGKTKPPDIMSWPRGSNIRPRRIQSNRDRKSWRRSLMFLPLRNGAPPATRRTGLPAVWPSMQKKTDLMTRALYSDWPRCRGFGNHLCHRGAALAAQNQPGRAHSLGTAAHDLLGQLDGLHQIMFCIQM